MRLPWQKKKKANAGGRPVKITARAEGAKEYDAALDEAKGRAAKLGQLIEVDAPGLGEKGKILATANLVPMIHQITAPIVWKNDPVGTRYGPGRCLPECTEVHAYAEKVSPTTVSFERPCCPEDMGAKEWRARQKR